MLAPTVADSDAEDESFIRRADAASFIKRARVTSRAGSAGAAKRLAGALVLLVLILATWRLMQPGPAGAADPPLLSQKKLEKPKEPTWWRRRAHVLPAMTTADAAAAEALMELSLIHI